MKKLGLLVTTALIAVAATGCQNWTGKNDRCCGKNMKCCNNKKMMCNRNNCAQKKHCGPKYQNNCRCSSKNQAS